MYVNIQTEQYLVFCNIMEGETKVSMFYIGEDGKKHLTEEHKAKMRAGKEAAKSRRLETGEKLVRKPRKKLEVEDKKTTTPRSRRVRKTTTVEEELYDDEA